MSRGKSLVEKAIKEQVSRIVKVVLEKLGSHTSTKQTVVKVVLMV